MSKCIGDKDYDCTDVCNTKCNDCGVPLCEKCVTLKWNTCSSCSKVHIREEFDHLIKHNVCPAYHWRHTQNNDKQSYQSEEWIKLTSDSFKTLAECEQNIEDFRKFLADEQEVKFNITYIISHWVDVKYYEDGSLSSGKPVGDKIYKPKY